MKVNKIFKGVALTLVLSSLYTASVSASSSRFVDLKFTIDSNTYTSNGITRKLVTSPFIQNGTTLVPLRTIMDELGYQTTWYEKNQTILCRQGNDAVRLKIGSDKATLNGTAYTLDAAPTIVNDITFVPLKFVSESAGASVIWNDSTQSILISKVGSFNSGTAFFYDSRDYYSYNGSKLSHNVLPDNYDFNSVSVFKGQVLVSAKDSRDGSNNLLVAKDEGYTSARRNFEVQQTITFGDYLLINGLNEKTNTYELVKYNGSTFETIASDFLIKKYIVYNGKLIINKYDSNRDYYLYTYDGKSLTQLYKGYVVSDFRVLDDNKLYMAGSKSTGNEKYLSRYDSVNFSDIFVAGDKFRYDLPFKLTDLVTTKTGQLYAYYDRSLHEITWSSINDVTFGLSGRIITLEISDIAKLNGSLVLNVTDIDSIRKIGTDGQLVSDSSFNDTAESAYVGLMVFDSTYSWKMVYTSAQFSKMDVVGDKVVAYGRKNNSDDKILLIYDSTSSINYSNYFTDINNPVIINNINSYEQPMALNGDVVMSVEETDPSTDKDYNKIIVYKTITNGTTKTYKVVDLLSDFDVDSIEKSGGIIYIKGRDSSDRNGVYKYDGSLSTLKLDSRVNLWQINDNIVFANFRNSDTDKDEFIVYTNGNARVISESMDVKSVTKLKNGYFLVSAEDEDDKSAYSGENVYMFNSANNTLTLMKSDFSPSTVASEN